MVKAKLILTSTEAAVIKRASGELGGGAEILAALTRAETDPARGGRRTLRIFVDYQTARRLYETLVARADTPPRLTAKVAEAIKSAHDRTRVRRPENTIVRDRRARHVTGGEG